MKISRITTVLAAFGAAGAGALQAQSAEELAAPVRITAGGEAIDTGADVGHAGPLVRDHDGDGRLDLLVSSFRGNIRFFANVGTRTEPEFEEGEPIAAGGDPIRIHNW